ncbi:alpha/beta hydrolase [Sphingomonadaceae bacterium jetA1]|uniref:alpha/beta hydrolase n=1 Tax=Facivitalis istanbulensis TaxID=3075838 RepID=UPI0034831DAC
MIDRRTVIGAMAAAPLAGRAAAQGHPPLADAMTPWPPAEHFPLWPGRAPGARAMLPTPNPSMNGPAGRRELWLRGIATPIVAVFRPERPDGRAVLTIPGGGYGFVSVQNEGIDVARTLNPHGITVFALAYRLPSEGWDHQADVPLQDAQRAMRLIRAQAGRYGIDADTLGVVGFSAGGHLAASLTVGYDDAVYTPVDAADRRSARPRFSGLIYSVASLSTPSTHAGSRDTLLGSQPDPATKARYDTPRRINATTPPLFLVHAVDDGLVPIDQSIDVLTCARAAKVPVEAHFFERGGHGFGARSAPEGSPARLWPDLFDRWIAQTLKG